MSPLPLPTNPTQVGKNDIANGCVDDRHIAEEAGIDPLKISYDLDEGSTWDLNSSLVSSLNRIRFVIKSILGTTLWNDVSHAEIYPQNAILWRELDTDIVSTSQPSLAQSQRYQTTTLSAQNYEWSQSFIIEDGTYTMKTLGATDGSYGITDWYIDDVLIASHDWYTGGVSTNSVMKTTTGIVIVGSGRHVLRGKIESKNASSSGYTVAITLSTLVKE